jgi:single stranded DNA-binding protein
MAFVRVEQRNAHLASIVKLDTVSGRDGPVSKGTVTALSNVRRGTGEGREEEVTSIQWTLWGKLAENAAEYLGNGSHVNIVGRLRNNNYENAQGETVYGLAFICEEIDYLDSRAESEARRAKQDGASGPLGTPAATAAGKGPARTRQTGKAAKASRATDEDVPF